MYYVQILPVSFPVFVTQLLIVISVRYYGVPSNVFTICAFIEQITGSKLLFSLKLAKIILSFSVLFKSKIFLYKCPPRAQKLNCHKMQIELDLDHHSSVQSCKISPQ